MDAKAASMDAKDLQLLSRIDELQASLCRQLQESHEAILAAVRPMERAERSAPREAVTPKKAGTNEDHRMSRVKSENFAVNRTISGRPRLVKKIQDTAMTRRLTNPISGSTYHAKLRSFVTSGPLDLIVGCVLLANAAVLVYE
ncbi:unnamed protein product, partial [Effrenium voratum]